MTPRLGMHFDDLDEAYNFYNAYGKLAGFSIRKESSNRGKDGEVVWKRFVCSKEGKTDEKHWIGKELVQRRRMETRFDCKAKLQVKLDKSGGYVVSMFVPQHSHAPATPKNIVYEDDVTSKFVVRNYSDEKEIEREVLWKKDEKHAYCSCKKFEFEGIPCCHVLSILRRGSILILPERYILKRWTKGVTRDAFVDVVESGRSEEKALMKTCNDLQCSMTIMQRRCHLLQCLAHRDCHHEYCYAHLLFEGKGYKGYGISYVGSGAINLANQYDTDAGSFFVKTNMSVQCSDCQMLEL
ncbi:hypothetical protein MRB53_031822 [Persea americana]|uniref:Uncharacterized protein n=1 Tax=Persea americana TaxID=3435 RepID=A0ACC2KQP0_PERAE|nr:hypothetical protein MRB53_031822 [Persea americana]